MGGHFTNSTRRADETPDAWLPFTAEMGALVNEIAGRRDIVAFTSEHAGEGAPACFKPNIAEMELNLTKAFGPGVDPTIIGSLNDRDTRELHPHVLGLIAHEASHARHSLWDFDELTAAAERDPRIAGLAENLEESRIEYLLISRKPAWREYVRAAVSRLILSDLDADLNADDGITPIRAARIALLTLARVDAGSAEPSDVARTYGELEKVLTAPIIDAMRAIWYRVQRDRTADTSMAPTIAGAEEILKLLVDNGMAPKEPEKMMVLAIGMQPDAGDGDGEGEGSSEMADALAADGAHTEQDAASTIADERIAESEERERERRAREAGEHRQREDTASRIFAKGTGPSEDYRTSSRLVQSRQPTAAERRAAILISRALERARYREREVIETSSLAPPGRLRAGSAVQNAAARSRGVAGTAEPWRGRRRRHTEDPNLTIGFMGDISGSMGYSQEPLSATEWVFSEAGRRVEARMAGVHYGNSVYPTLKPGQHLDQVYVYSAPDGTERFKIAFDALDGALNLLHGSGARLLVICSDMHYTTAEDEYAYKEIPRLIAAGVGVIILTFDEGSHSRKARAYESLGASVIYGRKSAAEMAELVGETARKALERASAARHG